MEMRPRSRWHSQARAGLHRSGLCEGPVPLSAILYLLTDWLRCESAVTSIRRLHFSQVNWGALAGRHSGPLSLMGASFPPLPQHAVLLLASCLGWEGQPQDLSWPFLW